MYNSNFKSIHHIIMFFLLITSLSCAQEINPGKNIIIPPKQMDDGWQTDNLKDAGIDSSKLAIMIDKINNKEYQGINSILIVKDNKLVFEEYFPGYDFNYMAKEFKGEYTNYDYNTIHNLASVTKSVTSLLFGIAVEKGYVKGVDEKLYEFFPADSSLFAGNKRNITLMNLLTMSSGLQWNENDVFYGNATNDIIQLFLVPDPLKYILSKPLKDDPGTKFYYNGGGTNLIGKIVQQTSGLRLDDFAQKYLFDPLGITKTKWVYIKPDFVYASGDLRLRPRDMAKLGSLVLNKGVWDDKQIVSTDWIEQMTKKSVWMPNDEGYGYQWWLRKYKYGKTEINSCYASGWGGQEIIVLLELNTVVVFTAENYIQQSPNKEIMLRYILPSFRSDLTFHYDLGEIEQQTPLPDNIQIIQPDDKTEMNIAAMSGIWYGKWDFTLPSRLVIEKINGNNAEIIYSHGDIPNFLQKGWMRKTATIDSAGWLKFNDGEAIWKYRYDKNENVITGYFSNGTTKSKIIMEQQK